MMYWQQERKIIQETGSINGADILYDMIPLTYKNGEILGAVITFNDAGTITRGNIKSGIKASRDFRPPIRLRIYAEAASR